MTIKSQLPAVVKFNMFYKRVFLLKQGLHQGSENCQVFTVQVFLARLARLSLFYTIMCEHKYRHPGPGDTTMQQSQNTLHPRYRGSYTSDHFM